MEQAHRHMQPAHHRHTQIHQLQEPIIIIYIQDMEQFIFRLDGRLTYIILSTKKVMELLEHQNREVRSLILGLI